MLYIPFIADKKKVKQICNKGTINVLQVGGGGGQQSMVKDHILTFFWDPSLSEIH